MQRIINGKRYNTETATLVACEQHRINPDTIARHFTVEEA